MNAKSPAVTVNVHQARTQFSRLLARAEAGEEVVIARNDDPAARLVGLKGTRGARRFGALRDRIVVDNRFFEPLPESELAAGSSWRADRRNGTAQPAVLLVEFDDRQEHPWRFPGRHS